MDSSPDITDSRPSLAKPSRPSRVYLRVTSPENATALAEIVRQTSFNDATNSARDAALIGPPALEFAPYSRAPGGRRRNDARQGLIDQDPEFKDFLESLTNPVTKPVPEDNAEGAQEKPEKVTTTPLIEHIREKKANKDKPQAKLAGKHGRGESRDDKSDKVGDKKILSKAGKENVPAASDKASKMSRAERAAKEAVKVLNKEASATQGGQTKSAETPVSPPERKRERGNASIAAKMLQRDLGLGPAPARRQRGKREGSTAPQDSVQKSEETTPWKEKQAEAGASAPIDKQTKAPVAPKPSKESNRPTRAERRAYKAAREEKAPQPNAEASKPQTNPQLAPVILKKPPTTPQSLAKTVVQPPKGPVASRALPTEPSSAKATPPTAPVAAQKAAQVPAAPATTPAPSPTGRQAFLKHANPSQGITEPLIEAALAVFGAIEKVEIDKRKGFAYVDFANPEGLAKAIAGSPVKIAQGAVQVLERKEKVSRRQPGPPTGPARGGRAGGFAGRGGRGRGGGRGGAVVAGEGAANPTATAAPSVSAAAIPAQILAPTTAEVGS
jgi:regulator of nonsense transcripts 3